MPNAISAETELDKLQQDWVNAFAQKDAGAVYLY
jgi:hypothetical protein